MFSRLRQHVPVFAPLGVGLLIITLITALGGVMQHGSEINSQLTARPAAAATAQTSVPRTSGPVSPDEPQTYSTSTGGITSITSGGSGARGTQSTNTPGRPSHTGAAAAPTTTSATQSAPIETTISVNLSVDGQSKGTVKLSSGSTQCDVLSSALSEHVISSLDMRYSSQYKTEGVYVIDGIGDTSTVWWTYSVNGHAPPYGCGYVTAHDGDSVNWQYVS